MDSPLPPFQAVVDAHWRDVARLARALAGPVDGEDVAQRAWERALAAYPTVRDARAVRGWLLTITSRTATDVHRVRARTAVPTAPDELPDRPASHPAGGVAGSAAGDPAHDPPDEDLWARVRALPERQRTAVALRYVLDLDHAQVARTIGTTPAATRRLVSDALATLRQQVPR